MLSTTGFLIDLDGTLYRGSRMIPGADAFVRFLQAHRCPFLFVTNNSTRTPEAVAQHLSAMGVDADAARVLTTAQAAAHYVREQETGRQAARVFLVGETGLTEAFRSERFEITERADDTVDYVIQGKDHGLTYDKLTRAMNHIRGGARYILTNPDLVLPTDNGLTIGAGSIAALLSAASQTKPVVIGKPSKIIMDIALARLGLAPEQTCVVGDNPMTDIVAGRAAGCRTALVLTGLTTPGNLRELTAAPECAPDEVYASLAELQRKLLESSQQ